MTSLSNFNVKIFADGADRSGMLDLYKNPCHQGLHDQPDPDAECRNHRL